MPIPTPALFGPPMTTTGLPAGTWYREREFWLVLLIAAAIYLPRLTTLTIRGEESRRAVIAREMIETGDWIVPRTQGVVRVSRPPFQNWLIALTALASGGMSPWAVRLPGFACTLATVGLIYWYSRRRLDSVASFVAAAAYASMLQVLEQGRTGETEPVLTLLVAASLLIWHGGWLSGWRPEAYWMGAAVFGGLAMLTKGLQGPLYFFGSTWGYLVLTGQWRSLLTRGHLLGLLTFAAVVGAWNVPFVMQMGWENGWLIYFSNVAKRFHDDRWSTYASHLLAYPPSIVIGCLAPWSLFLLGYLDRDLRRRLGTRRDMVAFLVIAIAVCFPSVWIPPEARPRYFMPLFPCFAVLVGIVAGLLYEVRNEASVRLWTVFVRGGGLVMASAGLGIIIWSLADRGAPPPLAQAIAYGCLAGACAAKMMRLGSVPTRRTLANGTVVMCAFLGLTYVGPVMTNQLQRSENLPVAVAEMRKRLPTEARLVSFDHVHHVFLHYFGQTVPLLDWPETATDVPADVDYFCVHVRGREEPQFPFAWEPVASLSVDRNRHEVPDQRIVVGRIIDGTDRLAATPPTLPR